MTWCVNRCAVTAIALIPAICLMLACQRERRGSSSSKLPVATANIANAAPDAAVVAQPRPVMQVRLVVEAAPAGGKKLADVLLEITEPRRLIPISAVSEPFVCQLAGSANDSGQVTCTPHFRRRLASIAAERCAHLARF
jgi:hypothetical protein